jgi:hypothetical protein
MAVKPLKPIINVRHRGKRVRVEFVLERERIGIRYDIFVDETRVKADLFAEEVIRWLGNAMDEEPAKQVTT